MPLLDRTTRGMKGNEIERNKRKTPKAGCHVQRGPRRHHGCPQRDLTETLYKLLKRIVK